MATLEKRHLKEIYSHIISQDMRPTSKQYFKPSFFILILNGISFMSDLKY